MTEELTTHTTGQCLRHGSPHLYPRAEETCGLWAAESISDLALVRGFIHEHGTDVTLGKIATATKMSVERVAVALDALKEQGR